MRHSMGFWTTAVVRCRNRSTINTEASGEPDPEASPVHHDPSKVEAGP